MPRVDPIQESFISGEISPRLWGRSSLDLYKAGLGKCENFIVFPHGGVTKRGGFRYVAEVKDSTKITIVQKFDYKNEFQYVFEFGHNYIRVFRNQAAVMGNGSPYEIVTTYTETEVQDLRFAQDDEKLYIVHKNHLPAELVRTAHNNWTLQNTSFSNVPGAWGAANYPTLVWFFEQRLWYASTPDEPNWVWGSKSASYFDFDLGTGLNNEGISVAIKKATKLLWAVDGDIAIILGAHNGEFKLASNTLNEALTPSNIRPIQITNYGNAFIPAVQIDADTLFVQRGLRKVRKLQYNWQTNSYKAIPITIISEHITESGIVDVAYNNEPDSLFWAVRTDGVLIAMTYEPEHKVFGWHRHIIGGTDVEVQSITNIDGASDKSKDELWAVIERTIDGSTVKYIEFLIPEGLSLEDKQEDAFFVESGITKELPELVTNGGFDSDTVGWTAELEATLASVVGGKDGNCLRITGNGQNRPRAVHEVNVTPGFSCTFRGYVKAGTVNTYRPMIFDITNNAWIWDPMNMEETAGDWSTSFEHTFVVPPGCTSVRIYLEQYTSEPGAGTTIFYDSISLKTQFTIFDGLDHLENEEVRILADGAVQAPKTVSNGTITLDNVADKAHAGLAYDAAIETLPLEGGNPIGTAQTKIKRISKIALRLYRSLTFYIGDVFGNEDVYPFGPPDEMGSAIPLFTGDTEEHAFPGGYDMQGRVRIASYDPLPLTILAVVYEVRVED